MDKLKLTGAPVAAKIYEQLEPRIANLKKTGLTPTLWIGIPETEDDQVYQRMLNKKAETLGICCMCDTVGEHEHSVVSRVVMETLKYYDQEISGKRACVIGRSRLVGLPTANALLGANATVTVCHSKTSTDDLYRIASDSDIIVAVAGVRGILNKEEWVMKLAHDIERSLTKRRVIIDVGCNVLPDGTTVGDIDPALIRAFPNALYTPVPGGIGPVTIATEMLEAVERCEREADVKVAMSVVSAYLYKLKDTGEIISAMVYTGADTLSQVEQFSGLTPHDTYLLSNDPNDMCCMINSPKPGGHPGFDSVKLRPGYVLIKRADGTFEAWPKRLAEQHYSNLEVLDKWLIFS